MEMAEGAISRLARQIRAEVLPAFARTSLLRLFPNENIGGEDITKWFLNILNPLSEPINRQAGGDWMAGEDKFDIKGIEVPLYDIQSRVTMNKSERAKWEKNGVLNVGIEEIGNQMANKGNKNLFIGKVSTTDQFPKTNNFYITAQNASSTDPANPSLGTAASAGVWDTAGAAQEDFANLAGILEKRGFNVPSSIVFYPEILSPGMRRPAINGASIFANEPLIQQVQHQGFLGAVSIKDILLPEESAGATPITDKWDLYAVDIGNLIIGTVIDENIQIGEDPIVSKKTYIDSQHSFTPAFKVKKYDTDGFYYKGVSRITAIDIDT